MKLDTPVLVPCSGEAGENGMCRHHPGVPSPHRVEMWCDSVCYCKTNFFSWPWCALMGPLGSCKRRSEDPTALLRLYVFGRDGEGEGGPAGGLVAGHRYDVAAAMQRLEATRAIALRQFYAVMGDAFSEEERPRYLEVLNASLKMLDQIEAELSACGWIGLGDQIQ